MRSPLLRDFVKAGLGLLESEIWDIAPGVSAIAPERRSALLSLTLNQPWYSKWIQRDYRASQIIFGPSGVAIALHKGAGTGGVATAADQGFTTLKGGVSGGVFVNHGQVTHNTSSIEGVFSYTVENQVPFGGGMIPYMTGADSVGVAIEERTFEAELYGNHYRTVISNPNNLALYNQVPVVGPGNLVIASASRQAMKGSFTVRTSALEELVSVAPSRTDWILICGPAALTRGEIYKTGFSFVAASASEIVLLLDSITDAIQDGNERARSKLRRDALAARAGDVFVSLTLSNVNPFELYSATKKDAKEAWGTNGMIGEVDMTAFKANLAANPTLYTIVSGKDPFDANGVSLAADPAIPAVISLTVVSAALTSVPGYTVALNPEGLEQYVDLVMRQGKVITVAYDEGGFTVEDTIILRRITAKIQAGINHDPNPQMSLSPSAQFDVAGLAAMACGLKPMTAAQSEIAKAFLEPGYMERMRQAAA